LKLPAAPGLAGPISFHAARVYPPRYLPLVIAGTLPTGVFVFVIRPLAHEVSVSQTFEQTPFRVLDVIATELGKAARIPGPERLEYPSMFEICITDVPGHARLDTNVRLDRIA
jgi:hypothetical protein